MYPIPANATRIRYLESTGTQYIDTGVPASNMVDVEIMASVSGAFSRDSTLLNAGAGYRNNEILLARIAWGNLAQVIYEKGSDPDSCRVQGSSVSNSDPHTYAIIGSTAYFDGQSFGTMTVPAFSSNQTIFVGATNRSSGAQGGFLTGNVYYVKIWQSNILVRDYIPVRVGQTGYLFDRVSGTLYGNAGTGAFTIGPDTFAQGVVPTRMMAMGVRQKEVLPTPLYTGVNLVGSSVQNNAGILSGFTTASYATMPFYFTSGASSLEAVVKFKTPNVSTTQGIWGCVGSRNSFTPFYFEGSMAPDGLRSFVSANGTSWAVNANSGGWTTSLVANTDTILRSKWNGTTLSFDILKNGAWTTERTLSVSGVFGAADLVPQLGTNRGTGWPFFGTIDLNYTYLYRDGQLWWEGAAGAYRNVKMEHPDA